MACEHSDVVFDASAENCSNCTYQWDDGDTNASRMISAASSKKYTVTISNVEGCSIQKSIDILVSNLDVQPEIIQPNRCGRKGSVDLIPSGQIGIPQFHWDDGYTSNTRNFDCSPRFITECKFYNKNIYIETDLTHDKGAYYRWLDIQNNFESLKLKNDDLILKILRNEVNNDC